MSKNLKKILITGASLLMMASVGAGISNVSVNASSNVSGDISQQDLNQIIAETDAEDAQTEANEIKTGIQQDAQDPSLAAYSASYDPSNFEAHKNEILPHYNKAQMKEFIYDFSNGDAPEGWTINAKGNINVFGTKNSVKLAIQNPDMAADDVATAPSEFNTHKKQILSHYNKSQIKDFYDSYYYYSNKYYPTDPRAKKGYHANSVTNQKGIRRPKKVIKHGNHKRARKPRKKVTKHVNKKHAIRKHRAKRIKRVAKKHTTYKARNYNYLGTYRQGFNQARRDYHNSGLINSSDKNLFNHLIRNRKLKSSKYFDGYTEEFRHMAINDEDSDFGDSYTLFISYIQEYLRGNNTTKRAISDFYTHNKPNKYMMKHNHQYKKVYNNIYLA